MVVSLFSAIFVVRRPPFVIVVSCPICATSHDWIALWNYVKSRRRSSTSILSTSSLLDEFPTGISTYYSVLLWKLCGNSCCEVFATICWNHQGLMGYLRLKASVVKSVLHKRWCSSVVCSHNFVIMFVICVCINAKWWLTERRK